MLGRLAELKELAESGPPVPEDDEKAPQTQTSQVVSQNKIDEFDDFDDEEYERLLTDMKEQYKEILEDEGVVTQALNEVRQRVENMEELVELQKEALLPSRLQQLANRFEGQELVCQRMIRRAKEALTALRDDDYESDDENIVEGNLRPVRASIARARGREFKQLVQSFFTARAHNREEMLKRATRQLRYAYPDALEEELSDILEFPELAAVAIAQRLEKGADGVTLDGILAQMEGKKADARKIEQGAKELKLMFLQFAELIDTQGESLNAIETNIQTVIEQTHEAIGTLLEAESEKRAYERKRLKFYIIAFILICWFAIRPAYKYVTGQDQAFGGGKKRPVWPVYDFFFHREKLKTDGGDAAYVAAHAGDGLSYLIRSMGSLAYHAGHKATNAVGEVGHHAIKAAGEELTNGRQGHAGQKPHKSLEPESALELQTSAMRQRVKRKQQTAPADHALEPGYASTGFIAPRSRQLRTKITSFAGSPILQQIALTATGGGITRHRGLRKSRRSPGGE